MNFLPPRRVNSDPEDNSGSNADWQQTQPVQRIPEQHSSQYDEAYERGLANGMNRAFQMMGQNGNLPAGSHQSPEPQQQGRQPLDTWAKVGQPIMLGLCIFILTVAVYNLSFFQQVGQGVPRDQLIQGGFIADKYAAAYHALSTSHVLGLVVIAIIVVALFVSLFRYRLTGLISFVATILVTFFGYPLIVSMIGSTIVPWISLNPFTVMGIIG